MATPIVNGTLQVALFHFGATDIGFDEGEVALPPDPGRSLEPAERLDDRHAGISEDEQQNQGAHKGPEDNPYQHLPGRRTSMLEVLDDAHSKSCHWQ
jgi:hypothetical protein